MDGFLPILDVKIKIKEDGTIKRQLYTEPANKGISLHAHSHHPDSMKKAIIKNEFNRARLVSTPDYRATSEGKVIMKLQKNGYSTEYINSARKDRKLHPQSNHRHTQLSFKMLFVSNEIDGIVQRARKRHGSNARVMSQRPQTVGQLCQKQRPAAKCKVRKCPIPQLNCSATFVSQMQPLWEHLYRFHIQTAALSRKITYSCR